MNGKNHKHYHRGRRKNSDKNYHRRRRKKNNNLISNIVLTISILVFLFAAFMLVKSLLPYWQGKSGYHKIQKIAITQKQNPDQEEDAPESYSVDFDELKKLNPDTVGWIRFDEPSIINYPIVQGVDNSQYLTQSFTADDNKLGAIFVNIDNRGDFSDRETIIYGHNMHYGGDMFTKMIEYENEDFYKKYPYFYIYTPDGQVSTYQVFAAEYVEDDSEIYGVSFPDDASFQQRIDLIKTNSLYQTNVDVTTQNKIVVLSTCTNFAKDQRFLLTGVKTEGMTEAVK